MARPNAVAGCTCPSCQGYPIRRVTSAQRDLIANLLLALPEPIQMDVEKALRGRGLRDREARELIAVLRAAGAAWRRAG